MNPVAEQFRAPNAIAPGPNSAFLGFLLVGLQRFLGEMARRVNLTAPKDGSELIDMVTFDHLEHSMTGNENNADLDGYSIVRLDSNGAYNLTGIVAGDGRRLVLINVSAFTITLKDEVTSTAANRLKLGADHPLLPEGAAELWYDSITNRWRMVAEAPPSRAFADIYADGVEVEHTITGTGKANRVQITAFGANGESRVATPDHTNDHITVLKAGKYLVNSSITIESVAGVAAEYGYSVYKNNGATEFGQIHGHRDLAAGGGQAGSCSLSGLADLAVGDTMEVWIWNETNTQNVKIDDINFSIVEVG